MCATPPVSTPALAPITPAVPSTERSEGIVCAPPEFLGSNFTLVLQLKIFDIKLGLRP
jgi:hypothetical protein